MIIIVNSIKEISRSGNVKINDNSSIRQFTILPDIIIFVLSPSLFVSSPKFNEKKPSVNISMNSGGK